MKKIILLLISIFIVCGLRFSAKAELIDRGGGLIYDTDLDVTWLQDANYAKTSGYDIDGNMHWDEATVWVENLTYGGYDDWRLPITVQPDPGCSIQDSGGSRGFNCRLSEMGHLFYNELNYIIPFSGCTLGIDCGLIDTGPFLNLREEVYWSETKWEPDTNNMWFFSLSNGDQAAAPFYNNFLAMAVRDGDVIFALPRPGQTPCSDSAGAVISCAGTGQDGEIQAGVPWPDLRFTDNGNGTVTDKLTGLMWTKDANAPGPTACSPGTTKAWIYALDYVACLNTNSYLGYTDWRLPNINELESLGSVEQSDTAVWLETQGFINVDLNFQWSSAFLSSTSVAQNPGSAWFYHMRSGYMNAGWKGNDVFYSWPVRSGQSGVVELGKTGETSCYNNVENVVDCAGTGQDGETQSGVPWPSPRFTVGTGTEADCVIDKLTGLMWTKNANLPGSTTPWQQALDSSNTLNLCGNTDWRLPNRKELHSLTDFSTYNRHCAQG